MEQSVFICLFGVLAYIRPDLLTADGSETVWLKEVTTGFATDKRTFGDFDLPNELSYYLKRGLDSLTLNLKRNYDINPNTDVYFAHRLDDGRLSLVKRPNLERETVAYYQDMNNGAYMTVRCVKRPNDRCNRMINGNIRIRDRSYDLRPVEWEVTSRSFLDVLGHFGKRYVLQDQADLHRIYSLDSKEQSSLNKKKMEQERNYLVRRVHDQNNQNQFMDPDTLISSRNADVFNYRRPDDTTRQLKKYYYVDLAVLVSPGVWDSYSMTVSALNPGEKIREVEEKIREAYSHIINGVNLLYKDMEDASISISINLCSFIFLQEGAIQHKYSNVTNVNGIKYVEALSYLKDLFIWDTTIGVKHEPVFDEAILFSDLNMYHTIISDDVVRGISFRGRICETGGRTAVIDVGHYVQTVSAAAHELGHSLGAWHDGEGSSTDCDPKDYFIMSSFSKPTGPFVRYSINPWLFSNCSVNAFKYTLMGKDCVKTRGIVYSLPEWTKYMMKQPSQVYTPNEQCRLINGPKSFHCGTVPAEACHILRCTDPVTTKCLPHYISAPMGTECGVNKMCPVKREDFRYDDEARADTRYHRWIICNGHVIRR